MRSSPLLAALGLSLALPTSTLALPVLLNDAEDHRPKPGYRVLFQSEHEEHRRAGDSHRWANPFQHPMRVPYLQDPFVHVPFAQFPLVRQGRASSGRDATARARTTTATPDVEGVGKGGGGISRDYG